MGQSIWLKSFENFKGVDYKQTPLTQSELTCGSTLNLQFGLGKSLNGRRGFQEIGGASGFVAIHNYTYSDPDTGATVELPLGINDHLFKLVEGSFTITETSANATSYSHLPTTVSGSGSTSFIVNDNAVAVLTQVASNQNTPTSDTVFELMTAIEALANFSVSFTGFKYAKVNGTQAGVSTITVDSGHTFVFGDIAVIYDTSTKKLTPRLINAITATTIAWDSGYGTVSVSDNQILGDLQAPIVSLDYVETTTITGSVSISFYYWKAVPWTTDFDPPFKAMYASRANTSWKLPCFVNAGNQCYIFTSSIDQDEENFEGYPFVTDGLVVRRAGLPKARVVAATPGTTGSLTASSVYKYKAVYKCKAATGYVTISQPSDASQVTLGVGEDSVDGILIYSPRFNTFTTPPTQVVGTVNGNQAGVTTITMNAMVNVQVGDVITILNRDPTPDMWIRRTVTALTSTTLTIDGAAIDVSDLDTVYVRTFDGANTLGAEVDGTQNNVTSITVDAGHTVFVGDKITVKNTASSSLVTKEVTAVTATTITVDGAAISVLDNSEISKEFTLELYRTAANGNIYYLVEEIPIDFSNSTTTYTDILADTGLGAQLLEPEIGTERDIPPKASIGCTHQGGLVYSGIKEENNAVAFSSIQEGLEAVPLASNYFDIQSNIVGAISAVASDQDDNLLVFKPTACYEVAGDLNALAFSSRAITEGDYGVSAQSSIAKIGGLIVGCGRLGIYGFGSGTVLRDFGEQVNPKIRNSPNFNLLQAVGVNDYPNRSYKLYLPNPSTLGSTYYAFDYQEGAWFDGSLDFSGGATIFNDRLMIGRRNLSATDVYGGIETRFFPTATSRYWINNLDFLDHIDQEFETEWLHLGEPGLKKLFLRFKLWRFEQFLNQRDFTYTLPLTFTIYLDYKSQFVQDTGSITFDGTYGIEQAFQAVIPLPSITAYAVKVHVAVDTTSVTNQTYVMGISGYEVNVKSTNAKEDFIITRVGPTEFP